MDMTRIHELMGTVTGTRNCLHCGREFQLVWRGPKRLYCSTAHRVAAYRKRRRENQI